ncbi:MAG: glutamine-hydrolyzing GMP synthase [Deltaproteobacteria bacterium]|nr:glutamine-hydrolyzing GMP synthase [Deltaproteobacteria bacterium]
MHEPGIPTVAVVDFGGQYAHLLARRIRALGVFSDIVEPEAFDPQDPDLAGVVLSGGPASVHDPGAPQLQVSPLDVPVPILGICYGHQWMARAAGGRVGSGAAREYGLSRLRVDASSPLFSGLDPVQVVWMSHGDHVETLPSGWRATASTPSVPVAAFEDPTRRRFGVQFHPEVVHTVHGDRVLDNFLSVCGVPRTWDAGTQERILVERIRREAEGCRLFLLVSGGVDSLVALGLCREAVGEGPIHALHVDTGLMRRHESRDVEAALRELGVADLEVAHAQDRFLSALAGVVDPEEKRRAIGRTFVEILREKVGKSGLGEEWALVQGTIYPDRIESGGSTRAERIKTHHNRVDEIEALIRAGRVLEPLSDLYKHEVRALGRRLGLPGFLLDRHPFPGPALGVRILCSHGRPVPPLPEDDLRGLADLVGQAGLEAAVLPVRSVGVQGDGRTYRNPAVVWGTSVGDWEPLLLLAAEVVNRIPGLNRVVWAPEGFEPGSIRLVPATVDSEALDLLREVDHVATREVADLDPIWQMPVVLLPLADAAGRRVVVLRPVTSRDAMTADVYPMPADRLSRLLAALRALPGVGPILYDCTTKPPATIEWE